MLSCKNCKNAKEIGMKSLPSGAICWCEKLKAYISIPDFRCSEHESTTEGNPTGICPVCNSNNIDFGDIDFSSATEIFQDCRCEECEAEFKERYEYFDTETIFNSKG